MECPSEVELYGIFRLNFIIAGMIGHGRMHIEH